MYQKLKQSVCLEYINNCNKYIKRFEKIYSEQIYNISESLFTSTQPKFLLNISCPGLRTLLQKFYAVFGENDDKYQTIIHRISIRGYEAIDDMK